MPSEEKQKINVWIPGSLWKQVGSLGYDSPTKATIAAFEALVLQEALGSNQEEFRKLQEKVRKYQEEIGKAPDLVTFAQLQARYEGIQEIIKEKDRSIERLENDLTKAGQREEDLKNMHNNYMLQVQSLINQRALAPSRSTKEENKTTARKEEHKSAEEEHKHADRKTESNQLIEKICKNCNQPFFTDNPRKEYCSRKCKDASFRRNKKEREPTF